MDIYKGGLWMLIIVDSGSSIASFFLELVEVIANDPVARTTA